MIGRAGRFLLALLETIRTLVAGKKAFIAAVFVFNGSTIIWSLWQAKAPAPVFLLDAFFLLSAVVFFTAVLGLIPFSWLRKVVSGIVLFSFALLWVLELFSLEKYQALIGPGMVTALLETNPREAGEFFRMYVGWPTLLFGGLGLAAGGKIYDWIRKRQGIALGPHTGRACLAGLFAVGLLSGGILLRQYLPWILNDSLDVPFVRVSLAASTAVENLQVYHDLDRKMAADVKITENHSRIPQVVFILGESTNRHYMHLYGYPLENTPNLDSLQKKGELAVFQDCVSPHATTVGVLRELFTFHDAESPNPWYQYHNLIDVMHAAGYKTYWLSNQESSGIWGNVAQLYAKRSDVHQFTRMRESHEDIEALDEELLPLLAAARQQETAKNFYVLHLMGGHSLYYKRFPYAFSKFRQQDIPGKASAEQKTIQAQYVNALLYNDYVVSQILGQFREADTLVFYLPDHGEQVFDDGWDFNGHVEENPNHTMLEVPFVIWASPIFRQRHPEKWAAIQGAVHRPYMTDDMIHTILDLLDIRTSEWEARRSLVNPAFFPGRKRLIQGKDYDQSIRKNQ